MTAFSFPFVAQAVSADPETGALSVAVWGQSKFRPDGAADAVQLQWRPADGSADWAPVGTPVAVNPKGFFVAQTCAPSAGEVRATSGAVSSLPTRVG